MDEDFGIFHMKLWKIKSDLILLPEARMICSYKSWQRASGEQENNCLFSSFPSLLVNFENKPSFVLFFSFLSKACQVLDSYHVVVISSFFAMGLFNSNIWVRIMANPKSIISTETFACICNCLASTAAPLRPHLTSDSKSVSVCRLFARPLPLLHLQYIEAVCYWRNLSFHPRPSLF